MLSAIPGYVVEPPDVTKLVRQKVKLHYPQQRLMSQSQLRHEDSERSGRNSF